MTEHVWEGSCIWQQNNGKNGQSQTECSLQPYWRKGHKKKTNVFIKHFELPKALFVIPIQNALNKIIINMSRIKTGEEHVKINIICLWCMNLSDEHHLMWSLTADSMACLCECRGLWYRRCFKLKCRRRSGVSHIFM